MGAAPTRLEITPEVVDLGDRVIQLSQVTSVRVGSVHPWRHAARYPLVAGMILLAGASVRGGLGLDVLTLLGVTMLVVTLAMTVLQLNRLVIATADGERVLVAGRDMAFLRLVLDRISLAMTGTDPSLRIGVDLASGTVESGEPDEPASPSVPTLEVPARTELPPERQPRRADPELPAAVNGAHAGLHGDALAAPVDDLGAPPLGSFAERRREAMLGSPLAMPAAAPPEVEPDLRGQILALIALIDDADIAHKTQIHALLDPVRDHFTGGRTRKTDARHHWKLFHDYALQYLGGIDGLPQACEGLEQALG